MLKIIRNITGNSLFYTWKRRLKNDIAKAVALKILLVLFAFLGPLFYSVLIQQVIIEKQLDLLLIVFTGYALLFVFSWCSKTALLSVSNRTNNKFIYSLKRMLINKTWVFT